jgi:2-(1,2-epoxy-1,2-dihydrophenyl)acetyl-CoA isomerase
LKYAYGKLQIDRAAPGVMRVLIDRPDKRNAIDFDVREQLIDALGRLLGDADVRALVLGGTGGHFSAGGDLPSMVGLSSADAHKRMQHIARLCRLMHGATIPVVTAMEGVAAGACIGLALLGDWIVAGEGAKILLPFMKLGLVPDWGMQHTLPQRVGLPAARRLFMVDKPISAREALQAGLVDDLAADGDVMPVAVGQAERFAALPQEAFSRLKARLNRPASSLDQDLAREEEDQASLLLGADFREGYAAFVEKRNPDFVRLEPHAK